MFLQQTMSPWFAIQRATQVTMILLALAMLVYPVLTQTQEAEAEPTTLCGICGAILVGIVVACAWHTINQWFNACPGYCGDWGTGEAHRQMCENGHVYYDCYPNAGWLHATCTAS